MVLGLGVDTVEVARMKALLDRFGARAEERLFTARERAACGPRPQPAECYAGRFAVKEACLKALGIGLRAGVAWREMEVAEGATGRPSLRLSGGARERMEALGAARTHLSLSHDAGIAVAVVVLED